FGEPLAIVVDDDGKRGGAIGEGCDALGVASAVLQDSKARRWPAELLQPCPRRRGLVRLGAQQDPVDWMRIRRIGQRAQRQIDSTSVVLQWQPRQGPARADRDVVMAGMLQPAGGDAADPAKPNYGDRLASVDARRGF